MAGCFTQGLDRLNMDAGRIVVRRLGQSRQFDFLEGDLLRSLLRIAICGGVVSDVDADPIGQMEPRYPSPPRCGSIEMIK
jgi:hypothetical protein